MITRLARAAAVALALLVAPVPGYVSAQSPDEASPLIDLGTMIDGLVGGGVRTDSEPAPPSGLDAQPLRPAAAAEPADRAVDRASEAAPRPAAQSRLLAQPSLLGTPGSLVTLGHDGLVRLAGERSTARLGIDLPPMSRDRVLVLTYRNSINVLPQDSALVVSVNGGEAVIFELDAFDGFRTVEIQSSDLVPGTNVVTVEANHRHRIFCGIAASFQIWTEIDFGASGVPISAETFANGTASFEAALANIEGGGPLTLRAAPGAVAEVVDALAVRLAAATGSAMEIGSAYDPVIDGNGRPRVVVGRGAAPSASVVLGGDGAVVLRVVHGPVPGAPSAALPDLDDLLAFSGAASSAGPATRLLVPGLATVLADLGYAPQPEIASFMRQTIEFRLPVDWLTLSSQQALLLLEYGFAEGLAPGARLLVKVNETTVRLLPLDRGGGVQPTLDIGFLASLLGPGLNRLSFEIIVEAQNPEFTCPPWPSDIVSISPGSTLVVPPMPRMHFDGMEWALPGLSASGVVFGQGERIGSGGMPPGEQQRFASLMLQEPEAYINEPPEKVSLRVLDVGEFWAAVVGELPIGRSDILAVLAPSFDVRPPLASALVTRDGGSFAGITRRVAGAGAWVKGLAIPGGPRLESWLHGRTAKAILLQPMEDVPQSLVLILAATADPLEVGRAVVADRLKPEGPYGRVSLFHTDGTWSSWRPPFDAPRLGEPLTPFNIRAVLGNYASWLPIGFTGILFLLTLVSSALALLFIVRTREPNQR